MKAIKVTAANAAAIETALATVNGKATAHAYTTAQEIIDLAERAESQLEGLGIIKSARSGAVLISGSGSAVPNSYKYSRTGTRIELQRKSSDWYLIGATQLTIFKSGGKTNLILTKAQDELAIAALRKQYSIATA